MLAKTLICIMIILLCIFYALYKSYQRADTSNTTMSRIQVASVEKFSTIPYTNFQLNTLNALILNLLTANSVKH